MDDRLPREGNGAAWRDQATWIPAPRASIDVGLCLRSGQVFTWRCLGPDRYIGPIEDSAVLLEQHRDGLLCATWPPGRSASVERFLRLGLDLKAVQAGWVRKDPSFERIVQQYSGLRVLRQRTAAATAAFICSACNNVPRITRMVRALAERHAARIETPWDITIRAELDWHDLTSIREADLREAGFGYRASHLEELGRMLSRLPANWTTDLEQAGYADAKAMLVSLPGVGTKVADCVCLFGLGHDDAVPVDTHVRRFVVANYAPEFAGRSLTTATYTSIAQRLRGIMGTYAGWAQQYAYMAARDGTPTEQDGGRRRC